MGDKAALRTQESYNRWLWVLTLFVWLAIIVVVLSRSPPPSSSPSSSSSLSAWIESTKAAVHEHSGHFHLTGDADSHDGQTRRLSADRARPFTAGHRVVAGTRDEIVEVARQRVDALRDVLRAEDSYVVEIKSAMDGHRCLDVQEGNREGFRVSNARVQLWSCSWATNQRWELRSDGTIRSKLDAAHCLDAIDSEMRAAAGRDFVPGQMFRCAGAVLRKWRYDSKTRMLRTRLLRPPAGREKEEYCLFASADTNGASVGVGLCEDVVQKQAPLARQWILA